MLTCNDCKYYFRDEEYCTYIFKKKFPYDSPICDKEWFSEGVFDCRFYVLATPLGYSTGFYYNLIDREKELNDIGFKYEDEADTVCEFLNKQDKRLHKLQLWVNEIYYENAIEKEYWGKHTPITD